MIPNNPTLLIYIPSYNRWNYLADKINILKPQVDGISCRLVISDNNSTDSEYDSLINYELDSRIEIVRLAANTGIAGNILHAFEIQFGDFVWILSDDDIIFPNSVATIKKALSLDLDLLYLLAEVKGEENIIASSCISSKQAFFANFTHCSMTGLISANVYNKNRIIESLSVGYEYAHTLFPHTAMFFDQIRKSERIKVRRVQGAVRWHFGERSYNAVYYKAWVYFFDLIDLVEREYRPVVVKKFLSDWAMSHYLPISFESGNLLKYSYYAIRNWRQLHFFLFYLLLFSFQKAGIKIGIHKILRHASKQLR